MMKRRSTLTAALALAASVFGTSAIAQSYPSRPVKVIVPYAVGGTGDILARLIAQEITRDVVEGSFHTGRGAVVQVCGRKPA